MAAAKRPANARRRDPAARPSQYIDWTAVANKKPDRVYVLPDGNDVNFGVPLYESMGYVVETWQEDGPRFARMKFDEAKLGKPMETHGHVLMSISKEEHEEEYLYGGQSGQGQRIGDTYERALVKNKGFADTQRGIRGPVFAEPVSDEEEMAILRQPRIAASGEQLDG